jgi:hypothetical protein
MLLNYMKRSDLIITETEGNNKLKKQQIKEQMDVNT